MKFDYFKAFSRNIGWLTKEEQEKIKNTRIAIAGMGGVGGSHLLTLTRLGIGKFHIADFDQFEIHNFNRQAGANMNTLEKNKVVVLEEMAKAINPGLEIKSFSQGVTDENIAEFLKDVDIYVDGLDAFVLDMRCKVFAECHRRNIPAVTVAPIGMGAALITFIPGKMSFEDYFGMTGRPFIEQFARFLIGLSPWAVHRPSLLNPNAFNPLERKAPSLPMGCELSAGVAASEVLKIVTQRGEVVPAPYSFHFDAFTRRLKRSWLPFGHKNPLFTWRLKLLLSRAAKLSPSADMGNKVRQTA